MKAGVPLKLQFNVSRVSGSACSPLAGALVDIWHCDAAGAYSDIANGVLYMDLYGFVQFYLPKILISYDVIFKKCVVLPLCAAEIEMTKSIALLFRAWSGGAMRPIV